MSQLEPDYADTFNQWKAAPSPATNAAMLKRVQPVLDSAVRNYGGATASPTLKGRAKILALGAMKSYDPMKGTLENHLYTNLRRLQRHAAQEAQIISMPERVSMDRKFLEDTTKDLADMLGRDPSDAEVAAKTGFSMKRLAHIRQALPTINMGQLNTMSPGGGDDVASIIPGQTAEDDAWIDFIYHDLGPVDQAILDHSLGRGRQKLRTGEIAARLGITPSAVSQRAAKIQKMIDERQNSGVL